MTIKIGISGIPISSKGADTVSGIRKIKELGLDIIEIQFVRNIYLDEKKAKIVGESARKMGITVTCHAPYYINLASARKDVQENSKRTIIRCAVIAGILGAEIVVIHPGYYSGRSPAEAYKIIEENLKEITNSYDSNVKIGLETTGRQKSFGRADEILKLCESNEKLCPVLDLGHIHALTYGGLKTKADFRKILDMFSDFSRIHIHISCMRYDKGNEKSHIPLSAKEPDFRHLAELLKEDKRDFTVICESPLLEHDARLFKDWLNEC